MVPSRRGTDAASESHVSQGGCQLPTGADLPREATHVLPSGILMSPRGDDRGAAPRRASDCIRRRPRRAPFCLAWPSSRSPSRRGLEAALGLKVIEAGRNGIFEAVAPAGRTS